MAIQYDVKAHVIDIAVDIPCSTDSIFVDSNVWFWQTYTRATAAGRRYQTIRYPNYIRSALRRGAKLYYSGLSFAELAHTIEKAEFDFGRATGIITSSTLKECRHNEPLHRLSTVREISAAWGQVENIGGTLDFVIDRDFTDRAQSRLQAECVDGHDAFLLESLTSKGISQILTDDGDYSSVNGIQLFTATRRFSLRRNLKAYC